MSSGPGAAPILAALGELQEREGRLPRAGSLLGSGPRVAVARGRDLVEESRFTGQTREQIAQLEQTLARTSLCGLGQVALGPLRSLVEREAARP